MAARVCGLYRLTFMISLPATENTVITRKIILWNHESFLAPTLQRKILYELVILCNSVRDRTLRVPHSAQISRNVGSVLNDCSLQTCTAAQHRIPCR